jgi:hypothetical protein
VVLNQTKEIMDSKHNIERFEVPVLSLLRQKITLSLTDGLYMTPLTSITETVMDKTGVTPDISNFKHGPQRRSNHSSAST